MLVAKQSQRTVSISKTTVETKYYTFQTISEPFVCFKPTWTQKIGFAFLVSSLLLLNQRPRDDMGC